MEPYRGFDLLALDGKLTDDERQVRDTVREFVEREAMPVILPHFREGTFPTELMGPLAGLGLFGAHIHGYGCAGLGARAYGLAMQELERGDSALRSFMSVQSSLAMTAIWLHGSEEQKQRWLPEMAAGHSLGAFALTEADHGSDPGGMETRAVAVRGGFRITGAKHWITNAAFAKVIVVWAKLGEGVRGFLVERDRPGVTVEEIKHKLSLRMSSVAGVGLDGVDVPEANLLPATKGLVSALECLNHARFGIAWGVLGAAAACLHETLDYAKRRKQFSRPIAGYQLVQAKLADMAAELSLGQLLAHHLADEKDAGRLHFSQISIAKYRNAQTALDIARACRDLLGAAGILDEFATMRHAMNLEAVNTYEGTRHMHQLILGRHLTGLSAFDG
ncbi:MAG: acyl-CoA dehydrogenase [SAR202 cluster bacterium]|nr:acyl-CoA dehydrogenase [SAR202 cluster bacterium]